MRPVGGLPALVITTLVCIMLLSPAAAQAPTAPSSSSLSAPDPLITEMLTKIDRWALYTLGYDLQNMSQPDRAISTTRNIKVTDWIEAHLTTLGLQIEKHPFTYGGQTRHNVIGTLPGTDTASKEIYITGGHMDTVPNSPGANDDGTGVVAAIHMAQIASGYRFKHTLKFGLWNGEEVGLVGSSQWAAKAKQEGQDLRLYVGMDMVGFSGKSAKEMWLYSNTQSDPFRATATQLNTEYGIGADLTTQNCDCRSTDHKSFWNQGFTAVGTASEQTAALDPTYHKPTDTVSHAMFDNLVITTSVNLALLATSAIPVGKAQAVDRIAVAPATASITTDQTQQFSAQAYDSANQQVNATFAWASSGGAVNQVGLFTPVQTGMFTVYANASGKTGSATVTVTPGALARIDVSPQTASVAVGQTQQFTAQGYNSANQPVNATFVWTSSGGSVDPTGLFTPGPVGAFTVSASASGKSGTATVTVTTGALANIIVSPPTASVAVGATQQFTAQGEDAGKNPVSVTPQWTVTGGGSIDAAGLFTASAPGSWTVDASSSSITGSAAVTVTSGASIVSISVDPPAPTVRADSTQPFKAQGRDAQGNVVQELTAQWWVERGKIDALGIYTPDKTGSWKVEAKALGLVGIAQVTVTPGKLDSLSITPTEASLKVGESAQFAAIAADVKGNEIKGLAVDWTVSPVLGTFDGNGKFTAKKTGSAQVTGSLSSEGVTRSDEAKVTVTDPQSGSGGSGGTNLLGNPMVLLALVAVVAIVVAGAAFALSRRRRKDPPMMQSPPIQW